MLVDRARDADATRRRKRLETRSDVHAIPEQVVGLDHHVAYVDANAEFQPAVCGNALIRLGKPLLCLHRALNGIHGARELGEHAVACGVGDPAAVLRDEAIQDLAARREKTKCPDLVRPHQAGIAGHVGRHDGGEPALDPLVRWGHRQSLSTSACLFDQCALIGQPRIIGKGRARDPITSSCPRRWLIAQAAGPGHAAECSSGVSRAERSCPRA